MRKLIMILSLLLPLFCHGQNDGIKFEKNLSWEQIKQKAMAENKYIFVDCYATWCGPCKWMVENVFPNHQVADFYNSNFINLSVQMDKTAQDNDEVKKWYNDAAGLKQQFNIHEYPNYLFFSPEGQLVHRLIGKTDNAEQFIQAGKNATNRDQQYVTLITDYTKHAGDSTYLLNALKVVYNAGDQINAKLIFNQYLSSLKQPVTPMIALMADQNRFITSTKDKGFKLFINNAARFDTLMHKQGISNFVEDAVKSAIFEESVKPYLNSKAPVSWNLITKKLKIQYPSLDPAFIDLQARLFGEAIMNELTSNFQNDTVLITNGDKQRGLLRKICPDFNFDLWIYAQQKFYYHKAKAYDKAVRPNLEYLRLVIKDTKKYENMYGVSSSALINNNIYYNIFPYTQDKEIISECASFMKEIVNQHPQAYNEVDTYANLLYKGGNLAEAIKWETTALNLAVKYGGDGKEYQTTLDKMKSGKPTW